jgi:hypothetical protein
MPGNSPIWRRSLALGQFTIKIPPEPVSQMPEQLLAGRHAHEGIVPHAAGNGLQAYEGTIGTTGIPPPPNTSQ